MKRLAAVVAGATGVALAAFAACSDSTSNSGVQPDGASDAAADEQRQDRDRSVDPSDTGAFNSEGWILLDYPGCNLYAAPSKEKMPSPIVWEPCAATVTPLGLSCRQIKFDWPPPTSGGSMAFASPSASVDSTGKVWLVTGRFTGKSVLKFVAEADGTVHQAITHERGACAVPTARLVEGKAIFNVIRDNAAAPHESGAIGGDVDKVPLSLEHWADGSGRSYYAGPTAYFSLGPENEVRGWTPGSAPLGKLMSTDPGQVLPYGFIGDELFYQVGDLSYSRIKVYSPTNGGRDLISFGNNVSANATDFGTDGVDMVWIEASGRATTNDPWNTIDIVTAKFTTDSSKVAKRRLRSEKSAIGALPFTVGCGYAAHSYSSVELGNGVRVVRLSDGHSWRLAQVNVDGGGYLFQAPRAISCDEIFVNVNDSGQVNTARIRLDSLGPGEPAD